MQESPSASFHGESRLTRNALDYNIACINNIIIDSNRQAPMASRHLYLGWDYRVS